MLKGVSWSKSGKCWVASIRVNAKYEHLGSFEKEIDAAKVYEKRAREIQGEFFKKDKYRTLHITEQVDWVIYLQKKQKSSRFRGLSWHKRDKAWRVAIRVNGERIELGGFRSEVEAAKAYDDAAKKYHGSKALLNFPKRVLIPRNYL